MTVFKCKMCGGTLEIENNATVATCEYCGTMQTLPKNNDEAIANLFNRANRLRLHCEFDKAEEIYEKILNLDDKEAEAHWGMVLCKYGIEYVEDPATFERIPTCHRATYEAVSEDCDYLAAIENADYSSKEIYEFEVKRIEEIQKRILERVKAEDSYDVFICYKETDEKGERTEDSVIAQSIYEALTAKGYRTFFSRITLEDKLGEEYEPYIFSALNTAKIMLVVGTKPEYIEAVWVRNEWSRFLKLIKKDNAKMLIPVYGDMDPYDLPESFAHLQAQNIKKLGALQDLIRGIDKIIGSGKTENEKESNKVCQVMLEEAFDALKDKSFAVSLRKFDEVLKINPENSDAYLGKLMAELKITDTDIKKFAFKKYIKNENYKKAIELKNPFLLNMREVKRRNKIRKRILILTACVMCVSVLAYVLTPYIVLEVRYQKAVKLMNGESYTDAITAFENLGEYRDSAEKIKDIQIKTSEVGEVCNFRFIRTG